MNVHQSCRGFGLLFVCIALGVLAAGSSGVARGQEDEIDAAIDSGRFGPALQQLRDQANAPVPKTDSRQNLAVFYNQRGIAHYRLGDYGRAVADLRLALSNTSPNDPDGLQWGHRFRIQIGLGHALDRRGDLFARLDHWLYVAEDQRSHPFRLRTAKAQLMSAYRSLGFQAQADKARDEAIALLPKLKVLPGWRNNEAHTMASHYGRLALDASERGDYLEAERLRRVAVDWHEIRLARERSRRHSNEASMFAALNNVSTARRNLSAMLASRGKYAEADILARIALRETLSLYGFETNQAALAIGAVAQVRYEMGDIHSAERYYRRALDAIVRSGVALHSVVLAARRADLANVYIAQNRWDDALRLFAERDIGLRSHESQFETTGSDHPGWAYALYRSGDIQRAAIMGQHLVSAQLQRSPPNRWALALARGVLGLALAASGQSNDALPVFQASIPDLVRIDQDDPSGGEAGFSRVFWRRVILEGYLELLAKLHAAGEVIPRLDLVDESFRIADIARGSSVQEAITQAAARAQLPERGLADLARASQDTLNQVSALNRILSRIALAPHEERLTKVIADMSAEIERLRGQYRKLREEVRKRYPEYADLIDPRPVGIVAVRAALGEAEALVSIYLGEAQSYVWTTSAAGVSSFRTVAFSRAEVEREVRALRKEVDIDEANLRRLPAFDLGRAYKLYQAFFELDQGLWTDSKVLNVIAHGMLGQLPMGLLTTAATGEGAAYGEAPWLIRKVSLTQVASASAFTALRRLPMGAPGRQPFIGFGDPAFSVDAARTGGRGAVRSLVIRTNAVSPEADLEAAIRGGGQRQKLAPIPVHPLTGAFSRLSALPDTAEELREIGATLNADPTKDVLLNRQATEKNVKQVDLNNRRVVAFATHAIAPGEITGLDQPSLVLSNPALTGDADNDGFLTMEEVLGLKLDADWVILSACNTASGDGRGSEAVSGLGRAFFYAGARSLLVSNWAVETTSARRLTTEIFKRQLADPKLTRAEALRQSLLDLMEKTAPAGFSYAHPVFWAPFTLVGDGAK